METFSINNWSLNRLRDIIQIDVDIMLDDNNKKSQIKEWFKSRECFELYELRSEQEHKRVIEIAKKIIKDSH